MEKHPVYKAVEELGLKEIAARIFHGKAKFTVSIHPTKCDLEILFVVDAFVGDAMYVAIYLSQKTIDKQKTQTEVNKMIKVYFDEMVKGLEKATIKKFILG